MSTLRQLVLYYLTLFIYTTLLSTAFAQTTYFVSGTGNDANDGHSLTLLFEVLTEPIN